LLAHGARIDDASAGGITAVDVATFQDDAAMVRCLLEHGASVDPKPTQGNSSPLINSVIDGLTEVVQVLLAKGAKIDARDGDGFTPLMWAATIDWGDSAILEALIVKGADVNARTASGVTALARAEQNGNARFAELLRKAGAKE
jgi:ankyrin repeat protein